MHGDCMLFTGWVYVCYLPVAWVYVCYLPVDDRMLSPLHTVKIFVRGLRNRMRPMLVCETIVDRYI